MMFNSPALNKKPQGARRLRSYVNRNGWIRDYISPVGGALNTWLVIFVCIVKCLLSGNKMGPVYHLNLTTSRNFQEISLNEVEQQAHARGQKTKT